MKYHSPMHTAPVDAEVRVDRDRQIVHVLDLDLGGMSVTNGIDGIRSLIAEEYGLGEVSSWQWWIYGSDGVVCSYDGVTFEAVMEPKRWHPDFASIMLARRRRAY